MALTSDYEELEKEEEEGFGLADPEEEHNLAEDEFGEGGLEF